MAWQALARLKARINSLLPSLTPTDGLIDTAEKLACKILNFGDLEHRHVEGHAVCVDADSEMLDLGRARPLALFPMSLYALPFHELVDICARAEQYRAVAIVPCGEGRKWKSSR